MLIITADGDLALEHPDHLHLFGLIECEIDLYNHKLPDSFFDQLLELQQQRDSYSVHTLDTDSHDTFASISFPRDEDDIPFNIQHQDDTSFSSSYNVS